MKFINMGTFIMVVLIGSLFSIGRSQENQSSNVKLAGDPYVYTEWESFTVESTHGALINDHIFCLEGDENQLWIGTEGGLVLYEDGKWKSWTEENGLPWRVISGITKSPKTGDLWLAMLGYGIARFSAGRFDHFDQMNSGLLNDVVYGVATEGDNVWAATTAGISCFNTVTGLWDIYNEKNAPMEEVWSYNVDARDGKVYVAVWGGGILEWDVATRIWKDYVDPDREMEIDLYRDDGLIHIITTSASYIDHVLWASTYFGLSRYDGRNWRGYMEIDSGLPSDFINLAVGRSGTSCYVSTDKGLAVLVDYDTDTWVTYKRDSESDEIWTAHVMVGNNTIMTIPTNLTLPNHFVICSEFTGNDLWIGTGHGLARGSGRGYWDGLQKTQVK